MDELYKTPGAQVNAKTDDKFLYIATVAKWQKALVYTFLVYLVVFFTQMTFENLGDDSLSIVSIYITAILGLTNLFLFIALVLFNGLLCWKVYGKFSRFLVIIIGFVPLINLFVILAASARASKIIRKAGYKVGFLGAKLNQADKQTIQ